MWKWVLAWNIPEQDRTLRSAISQNSKRDGRVGHKSCFPEAYRIPMKLHTVTVLREGGGKEKKEPCHSNAALYTPRGTFWELGQVFLPFFQLLNIPLFLHGIVSLDIGLHTPGRWWWWGIHVQCATMGGSSTVLSSKTSR